MKKILVILVALLFVVSGCDNKEHEKVKEQGSQVEETSKEDNIENETNEEENTPVEKQEESKEEPSKNNTTSNKNEATTTKKPSTNKPQTTGGNESKKEEVQKPTCIPKKFKNKYSYVYTDKATCMKQGNLKFLDITDNTDPEIFAYNCEEIVDDCGTKYYGVVFYKWSAEKGEYPVYY